MRVRAVGALILTIAALLTVSVGQVAAVPILTHQGKEDFYSTGGTQVTGCQGSGCQGSNFSFGDITGTIEWEVVEKVFYDSVTNTTKFSYTVFNDTFSNGITSFHVQTAGVIGVGSAPTGWTLTQTGGAAGQWSWSTGGAGIPQGDSLDTMSVILGGNIPVTFRQVEIDFANGTLLSSADWLASSPVPEPATLMLLGSGLVGLGWFGRKRLKHDDHRA